MCDVVGCKAWVMVSTLEKQLDGCQAEKLPHDHPEMRHMLEKYNV